MKDNTLNIISEYDLHCKYVEFIRKFYPWALLVVAAGELQDTPMKRCKYHRLGYMPGTSDLLVLNAHRKFKGLCIEFKSPKGHGRLSEAQKDVLSKFESEGFLTIVSNDYDLLVHETCKYFLGVTEVITIKRQSEVSSCALSD